MKENLLKLLYTKQYKQQVKNLFIKDLLLPQAKSL